jgi:hypothetical protein
MSKPNTNSKAAKKITIKISKHTIIGRRVWIAQRRPINITIEPTNDWRMPDDFNDSRCMGRMIVDFKSFEDLKINN